MGLTSHINVNTGPHILLILKIQIVGKKTDPLTDSRFKISMKLDLYPHA